MITSESLIQVKAFARQDGMYMSLVWLASMWLTFHSTESVWGPMLALCTPFFVAWRLQSFRDYALDGLISFRRGLMFACYMFFYASLIFAVGQFVYFKFLDGGLFMQTLTDNVEVLKPLYKEQGVNVEDLDLALKTIGMMKPVDLTFTFMMYNISVGAFLSPIISLFCKKNKK